MTARTSSLCSLTIAAILLLQPAPAPAWEKSKTSGGRVPDAVPLRPTADVTSGVMRLTEPVLNSVGSLDLNDAPNGLELSVAELPNLKIFVPPDVLDRMTPQQKGALVETVNQYRKSADLVAVFERVNAAAGASIQINYGNYYTDYIDFIDASGATYFPSSNYFGFFFDTDTGHMGYQAGSADTLVAPGSIVHVSINDLRLIDMQSGLYLPTTTQQFAATLLHELIHLLVPGRIRGIDEHTATDEPETLSRSAAAYEALFTANGLDKLSDPAAPELLAGLVMQGTAAGEVIAGGTRNDSLAGGAGQDTLYGQGGNDVLMGDAGDDHLLGGPGNNLLDGGTGSDHYEAQGYYDIVMDESGSNDVLVARDVEVGATLFYRESDTLFILESNGAIIQVDRQWLPDHRVETFELRDGTYTWEAVQQLATPSQ